MKSPLAPAPSAFVLLLPLLLLGGTVRAQMGASAGASLAAVAPRPQGYAYQRASGRAGFQASIFYEQPLSKRLSLVPAVQYSHQASAVEQGVTGHGDYDFAKNYRLGLGYVSVPVLLRATFGRVYAEAGPQAGLLLGAREQGTTQQSPYWGGGPRGFDRSVRADYRRLDAGVCAGAGVKLPAGLGAAVRAYWGMPPLPADGQENSYGYAGSLRNRVLQASLSYQVKRRS